MSNTKALRQGRSKVFTFWFKTLDPGDRITNFSVSSDGSATVQDSWVNGPVRYKGKQGLRSRMSSKQSVSALISGTSAGTATLTVSIQTRDGELDTVERYLFVS